MNWQDVTQLNEVNESLNIFLTHFDTGFELCFPLKTVKFNKNFHPKNRFMTSGLIISRSTKLSLYKQYLLNSSEVNQQKYKLYRNIYNRVLKLSKKLYYETNFNIHKKNPKKTWQLLNEMIGRKQSNDNISKIKTQTGITEEPLDIAETFNNFFASIGPKIANSVPKMEKSPVIDIPDLTPNIEFNIGNIDSVHFIDLIKSMPSKPSVDISGISIKLLKYVMYQINVVRVVSLGQN